MELITQEILEKGISWLCARDNDLKFVVEKHGNPPLWNREPGFATLINIILEQQVSLASAAAAFRKLQAEIDPVDPENFLSLDDLKLKEIGFSRQKAGYASNLAHLIYQNELNLEQLHDLPDEHVAKIMLGIKGIGRWTVDIYLLMALCRRDIMPQGDLALIKALHKLKKIPLDKKGGNLSLITDYWKPWRSVAARILWHFYLSETRISG